MTEVGVCTITRPDDSDDVVCSSDGTPTDRAEREGRSERRERAHRGRGRSQPLVGLGARALALGLRVALERR